MKMSKDERNRLHKEKCRELKQIRARIAEDLGIRLLQSECTYEGYCSGICPKCKSEEMRLNAALMKKQMEEVNLKGRIAAAGLTTVAALCLSGCGLSDSGDLEGATTSLEEEILDGDVENTPDTEETLDGAIPYTEETEEFLEGDVEYIPDAEENDGAGTELMYTEADTEVCDTESANCLVQGE